VPHDSPLKVRVHHDFYVAVLRCLQDEVHRKGPEMWTVRSWLLHHNNVPARTALSIRQFLAKHSIPTLPQPSYSPELSPPDFFLFPKLRITFKRKRFQIMEDIITNVTNDLKAIPQTSFGTVLPKVEKAVHCCERGLF
jgi:transposase